MNRLTQTPWAISADALQNISRFAASLTPETRGKLPTAAAPSRPKLSPGDKAEHLYIYGPLVAQPDPVLSLFGRGYTTYASLQKDIASLQTFSGFNTVIMHINSPGGTVEGLEETYRALRSLGKIKKLVALNEGEMHSGAYWLASAASEIYAVNETAMQGSIGVISGYVDTTTAREKAGIIDHIIVSKNARLKHPHSAPDSQPDYDASHQAVVDDLEDVFIGHIAEGRRLSVDHVRQNFGKGAVLTAKRALSAGMIDGIRTLDEIISAKVSAVSGVATPARTAAASRERTQEEIETSLRRALGRELPMPSPSPSPVHATAPIAYAPRATVSRERSAEEIEASLRKELGR